MLVHARSKSPGACQGSGGTAHGRSADFDAHRTPPAHFGLHQAQHLFNAGSIVMRSPLSRAPAASHVDVHALRIKEPARSEAISLSVALNRPDRSFGAITDSSASSITEESARVYISVVCMFAWPSQRETFRRSWVACKTVSAQVLIVA